MSLRVREATEFEKRMLAESKGGDVSMIQHMILAESNSGIRYGQVCYHLTESDMVIHDAECEGNPRAYAALIQRLKLIGSRLGYRRLTFWVDADNGDHAIRLMMMGKFKPVRTMFELEL